MITIIRSRIERLLRRLRDLRAADGANVTITFALTLIPIVGFVGAAVDYSRANSVKIAMQAAADSTALMLSKNAATLTTADIQTKATDYFNALLKKNNTSNVQLTATYTSGGGSQVVINATTDVKTNFMGMMGFSSLKVGVTSQVKWGNTKLRVALVLDTTGSMDSAGKMTAMQTATKNLLTQLQNAATNNGDVYVSIVPFVKDVNLGASNYNATWIDWTDWQAQPAVMADWIADNTTTWEQTGPGDDCPFSNSSHGFRCAPDPTSTSTTSTVPSSGTYKGYICPGTDNGSKYPNKASVLYNGCYTSVQKSRTVATGWSASCGTKPSCSCSGSGSGKTCAQTYFQHDWVVNAKSTWNGCVVDRGNTNAPSTGNYDTNAVAPTTATQATLYAAEQYTSCPEPVMSLSYNWLSMKNLVNSLAPSGNTNQGIGLQLGWMSLVGGGPFTVPTMDANYKYSQVIILLTDGLNTQNRWYNSATQIDTRQATTCTNAKAAGVTIYAIQVNTDGDPTSTMLQNCASSSDKFFLLTSANQIVTTFNSIGTALSNLRIAQ